MILELNHKVILENVIKVLTSLLGLKIVVDNYHYLFIFLVSFLGYLFKH
jgi:hypothetical protein